MGDGFLLTNLEETVEDIRSREVLTQQRNLITFLLDTLVMPDFSGKSLREVAKQCAGLSLRLNVSGSGIAVGQRPGAGERVSRNTLCEVFFSSEGQKGNASAEVAFKNANGLAGGDQRKQN